MIVARVQPKSVERPELHLVQDAPRDRPALPEVLRLALAAWPNPGKDAHSDILAGVMGWDRGDLVAAMKREGVEHMPVHQPRTDAQRTTARGFKLADVEASARELADLIARGHQIGPGTITAVTGLTYTACAPTAAALRPHWTPLPNIVRVRVCPPLSGDTRAPVLH